MHTDSHRSFLRPTQLVLIVGLLFASALAEVPTSQPVAVHHLRFSLVAGDGEAGDTDSLTDPSDGNKTIKVFKEAVIDERAISEVHVSKEDRQQISVSIQLTDAGGKIFHQFTKDHIDHRMAVVVDGKVVECANIMTPISKSMVITVKDGFTEEAAEKLVGDIRAAMRGASTQPVDAR